MNHKSEMMAQLVPKLQLLLGQEKGEEVATLFIYALQPFDLVPADRSMVVYDGTDKSLVGRFFVAKAALGLSQRTLTYYKKTISAFLNSVQKHIKDITTEDIRLYIMSKKMDGVSAVSQNNIRRNLSSFFTFLHEEGLIANNPLSRIKKIREDKKIKDPFSESEVEMMRQAAPTIRDRAIIDFLMSTGCRVSEMTTVNKDEIDWKLNQIMIKGKGSKYRVVYLNARAVVSLKQYLDSRSDTCNALFVSHSTFEDGDKRNPLRLSKSGVEVMIRNLGKKLNIEKAHPHRFRRTAATLALRRGMPIEQVSKILGHASLNTTTIYANSTQDDLAIAHRKFLS